MKLIKFFLLITIALPLSAELELKVTQTTSPHSKEITARLDTKKHDKQVIARHWTNFSKQIVASYGASYATKILYRILAYSSPNLAECTLIQLLFGYIAASASDDAQQLLTEDSSLCATILGALFALATNTPLEFCKKICGPHRLRY